MKHRVKVQYTVELDKDSQADAVRQATYDIPTENTTNVVMECWTPKQKVEPIPITKPGAIELRPCIPVSAETVQEPAYPVEGYGV